MLKVRIIPCLTIKDLKLVKSVQFKNYRNIGNYIAAAKVFNARDVDEMIFLDLDASSKGLNISLLGHITKECFMPLTIGGGIKTLSDIAAVLKIGADKISINRKAFEDPDFIRKASRKYGNQCIVVSIDVKKTKRGFEVFINNGKDSTGLSPLKWARQVENLGAGEILLTSIDNDGKMKGYDLKLVKSICREVEIPVIANGGAGHLSDFVKVIKSGASAAAASSIFQYTQITPNGIKAHLRENGIEARI